MVPPNIDLVKVNNRNNRKNCDICLKLTMKTLETAVSKTYCPKDFQNLLLKLLGYSIGSRLSSVNSLIMVMPLKTCLIKCLVTLLKFG